MKNPYEIKFDFTNFYKPEPSGLVLTELCEKTMINEEKVLERISELEEFIRNFPNSLLCQAFHKELEYLNSLLN